MAFLVADKVTTVNGVKLNEKIIPLNAKRWELIVTEIIKLIVAGAAGFLLSLLF